MRVPARSTKPWHFTLPTIQIDRRQEVSTHPPIDRQQNKQTNTNILLLDRDESIHETTTITYELSCMEGLQVRSMTYVTTIYE
jgi:hypothetical protein